VPFDFRTYFTMFRLAFRDHMSSRRRVVVIALLFLIPLVAVLNAVTLVLDYLLFPGFRKVAAREPVFIIGHARSGTTLMHRLLTADERMSWFMTYELFFPAICLRKLIRAVGTWDRERRGGKIERRIKAWEDRTFAKGRQMHPMSLTGPEEDEFVLATSCMSGVWVTIFPYMRELDYLYYTDEMPAARRRRVLRLYQRCVQRQLYLNGPDKIHCSKNPTFAGKLESLIETFPDARFIVMNRNPCETIPSLLKMMERNWKASDCDRERMRDSLDCLGQQSFHTYKYPYKVLARHPEIRHAVVDYRELVARPKATVERVYSELELAMTPELEESLVHEEQRSKEHRAEHVYSLDEYRLKRDVIRAELAGLFERFGWDSAGEAGVTTEADQQEQRRGA
jgi:hypothetical protein